MNIGREKLSFPYIMAPLAGHTDLPFRLLVRGFGCKLAYTEMVSSEGLVRKSPASVTLLGTDPADHPLAVQIFGSNPEVMARAAALASQAGADIIDINMGCSVKKVVRTGAGAALLNDLPKTEAIFKAVRKATALPLTVKLRKGWRQEELTCLAVARLAEDSGLDAVTIHPRSALQGFSGKADWSVLEQMKNAVRIPVIGNGDIVSARQALEIRSQTGCQGVMIGRQALLTPWIFKQIEDLEKGQAPFQPGLEDRRKGLEDYWERIAGHYPEAARMMPLRKGLFLFTRGLKDSCTLREKATLVQSPAGLRDLAEAYWNDLARI